MKMKLYNKVNDFSEENEAILLKNEAVTQLLLFNALKHKGEKTNRDLVMGQVEGNNGKLKLIFVNPRPFNLLVYDVDSDITEAVETLADYIISKGIEINGINANGKVCDAFMDYYANKTGRSFKVHLSMDVMELTELNKNIVIPKGYFRVADEADRDTLIKWHKGFAKEALHEGMKYEDFKDRLDERIKGKCIYIYEDEKHVPMAMAASTRQLVNGVSVSLVYSCREGRGKGYGLAVVYSLSCEYLSRGNKFLCLFVDKNNPISNGVYKKIGYKILEDNYDYTIV